MKLNRFLSGIIVFAVTAFSGYGQIVLNNDENTDDFKSLFNLAIQIDSGFRYGSYGEYVFLKDTIKSSDTNSKPDNTFSYLEWETKPEWYAGIQVETGWKDIFLSANFNASIPADCGTIYDSDWLNIQYSGLTAEQQSWKTNYSESDNHLDYNYSVGAKAGYNFKIFRNFSLAPFAQFTFSKIKFTAWDGFSCYGNKIAYSIAQYSCNSENVTKGTFSGRVLEYTREQTAVWIGADIKYQFGKYFAVSCGISCAPYVYTFNTDYHPLRTDLGKPTYIDVCQDSFCAWKYSAGGSYQINSKLTAGLNCEYKTLSTISGKSYKKTSGQSYQLLSTQEGGADSSTIDVSASIKYTFF